METCLDCIHRKVCPSSYPVDLHVCEDFKNVDDFVEVVRCKNCEFCECSNEAYYCVPGRHSVRADDYCSYEQKKTK